MELLPGRVEVSWVESVPKVLSPHDTQNVGVRWKWLVLVLVSPPHDIVQMVAQLFYYFLQEEWSSLFT